MNMQIIALQPTTVLVSNNFPMDNFIFWKRTVTDNRVSFGGQSSKVFNYSILYVLSKLKLNEMKIYGLT
jgi:hypothetical protein